MIIPEAPLALTDASVAVIGVVLGGGFLAGIAALRKVGPERTATVVDYQGNIIEDLNAERERLGKAVEDLVRKRGELQVKYDAVLAENAELRERCDDLARRVETLERRTAP